MSAHRTSVLSYVARGLAAASIVTLAVIGVTGAADANVNVTPVTNYSAYPEAIPAGCPAGAGALEDLSFSNGRGDTADDLGGLAVKHGDTVTMSWLDFHQGCLDANKGPAIMVGMAAYDRGGPAFDPNVDQKLLGGWKTCGAGADPCAKDENRYHLSVITPTTLPCDVQLDAFMGRPLKVVGPNGSFYSASLREDSEGQNRLLSAAHLTLKPCEESTATTPTTPTTAATTTTTTPTPSTLATMGGQTMTRNAPAPVVASANAAPTTLRAQVAQVQLPATGRNSAELLRLAAWLCLAGAAILMVSSALNRRFLRW